jgi:hypothetical protein
LEVKPNQTEPYQLDGPSQTELDQTAKLKRADGTDGTDGTDGGGLIESMGPMVTVTFSKSTNLSFFWYFLV